MKIELKTDLKGRVNNISEKDILSEPYMPLYEAIINSLHAIEETKKENGEIIIKINRQNSLIDGGERITPILGFTVIDNGIGFNEENFQSFLTSDSSYKFEKGGKGIGRFTWLKVFEKVLIISKFIDSRGDVKKREIKFDLRNGIVPEFKDTDNNELKTIVELINIKEKYRARDKAYKTSRKISQRILEHFLSFYILNSNPKIIVEDGNEIIDLSTLYNELKKEMREEEIIIQGEKFILFHLKWTDTHNQMNKIVYCGHNRQVIEENIDLLGESSLTDESNQNYYYACYVRSDYLDRYVDGSRTSFSIPQREKELSSFLDETKISFEKIRKEVLNKIHEYLNQYFKKIEEIKKLKLSNFMQSNPQSRFTINKFKIEIMKELKTKDDEEKINFLFYKYKGQNEFLKLQEIKDYLTDDKKNGDLKKNIDKVLESIEETEKDNLVHYMVYRKCIISLLEKYINVNTEGKIEKEKVIHNLIFKMNKTSDEVQENDLNLWILDEKLIFHSYATSDLPLNKIVETDDISRPDVLIFSDVVDSVVKSVCIIELKKPYTYNDDPVSQLFGYVDEIRKKNQLKNLKIRVNPNTIFFCYAVCDIDENIRKKISNYGMQPLPSDIGYITYNHIHHAFLEVRSYDRILEDVIKRHKMFFSKLGIEK